MPVIQEPVERQESHTPIAFPLSTNVSEYKSVVSGQSVQKQKTISVFVESNIEFQITVPGPNYTCGWLQSEVIRKYYEVLQKQAQEW
jgi:hypothetical protein